eukprot:scaffold5674_cov129-Isochrysis_galbana.AAC.3
MRGRVAIERRGQRCHTHIYRQSGGRAASSRPSHLLTECVQQVRGGRPHPERLVPERVRKVRVLRVVAAVGVDPSQLLEVKPAGLSSVAQVQVAGCRA